MQFLGCFGEGTGPVNGFENLELVERESNRHRQSVSRVEILRVWVVGSQERFTDGSLQTSLARRGADDAPDHRRPSNAWAL